MAVDGSTGGARYENLFQVARLLNHWPSADMLAEELFATFNKKIPMQIGGPVTITNEGDGPMLILNGRSRGNQSNSDGEFAPTQNAPEPPDEDPEEDEEEEFTLVPPADIQVEREDGTTTDYRFTDSGLQPVDQTTGQAQAAGGGVPGKILSGSGSSYTVELYANGPSKASTKEVTVTQLQIDSGETIPAGTWTFVSQIGDGHFMQVPVWL